MSALGTGWGAVAFTQVEAWCGGGVGARPEAKGRLGHGEFALPWRWSVEPTRRQLSLHM